MKIFKDQNQWKLFGWNIRHINIAEWKWAPLTNIIKYACRKTDWSKGLLCFYLFIVEVYETIVMICIDNHDSLISWKVHTTFNLFNLCYIKWFDIVVTCKCPIFKSKPFVSIQNFHCRILFNTFIKRKSTTARILLFPVMKTIPWRWVSLTFTW